MPQYLGSVLFYKIFKKLQFKVMLTNLSRIWLTVCVCVRVCVCTARTLLQKTRNNIFVGNRTISYNIELNRTFTSSIMFDCSIIELTNSEYLEKTHQTADSFAVFQM